MTNQLCWTSISERGQSRATAGDHPQQVILIPVACALNHLLLVAPSKNVELRSSIPTELLGESLWFQIVCGYDYVRIMTTDRAFYILWNIVHCLLRAMHPLCYLGLRVMLF